MIFCVWLAKAIKIEEIENGLEMLLPMGFMSKFNYKKACGELYCWLLPYGRSKELWGVEGSTSCEIGSAYIDVRNALKRRMKIRRLVLGSTSTTCLPTFCFICGILGGTFRLNM